MDGLDDMFLRLSVGPATDLGLVLGRPCLVLSQYSATEVSADSCGTTHQKYHDIGNTEIEPSTAHTGEDKHSGAARSVELGDSLCSLLIRHCSIDGKTSDPVKLKNLEVKYQNASQ